MDAQDEQAGFEYQGTFYPWAVTAFGGKDMILIDRITGMPLDEFQEVVNDETSSMRGTTLLALMAISVRAKYPQWSPERVYRMILELELEQVTFVGGDDQEEQVADRPPAEDEEPPPRSWNGSSDGSLSSATREEPDGSVISAGTQA